MGNALAQRECPPVNQWGWLINDDKLFIQWKTLDCGQKLTVAIGICSCSTNRCNRKTSRCLSCSCATRKVKCLIFYKCKQNCKNPCCNASSISIYSRKICYGFYATNNVSTLHSIIIFFLLSMIF